MKQVSVMRLIAPIGFAFLLGLAACGGAQDRECPARFAHPPADSGQTPPEQAQSPGDAPSECEQTTTEEPDQE